MKKAFLLCMLFGLLFQEIYGFSVKDLLDHKIRKALDQQAISKESIIQLDAYSEKKFFQTIQDDQFECQSVQFDPMRKSFSSIVQCTTEPGFRISGTIIDMIDIPVLTRPIAGQETIQSSDISWLKIPSNKVNAMTITSPQLMIGHVPRNKTLYANTPLSNMDLQKPILVRKGSIVMVRYTIPYMELTAQAIAKRDGALGETIEFSPMSQQGDGSSKKMIYATVVGANQAQIQSQGQP